MQVTVESCPSCHMRHEKIEAEAKKLTKKIRSVVYPIGGGKALTTEEKYNDWDFEYVCPVSHKSISLTVVMESYLQ